MSDKCILGGKVANAIDIHKEALHLTLQPVVMLILLLMQGNEKLSVIENTRTLSRPLSYCAFSGFSTGTMRCTCIASQRINTSGSQNSFNGLSEALVIGVVKINGLIARLWVYGFDRQINL